VDGLKNPTSFIVDPALGNYFISNINGKPVSRDNNGFILKLNPSGKTLLNIRGGDPQITLNAPDGLALRAISYISPTSTPCVGSTRITGGLSAI
jgi:hypothetical protein